MARIFADSDGPCKGDSCLLEEDLQRSPTPGVLRHEPMRSNTSSVRQLQQPCALPAAPWSLLCSSICCSACTTTDVAPGAHAAAPRAIAGAATCTSHDLAACACLRPLPRYSVLFIMRTGHCLAACTCFEGVCI